MGILVRQVSDKWLIELRETWFFKHRASPPFKMFEGFAHKYKLVFQTATAPNDWFSVQMMNSAIEFPDEHDMLLAFEDIVWFKANHGDSRLPLEGKVPTGAVKMNLMLAVGGKRAAPKKRDLADKIVESGITGHAPKKKPVKKAVKKKGAKKK